MTNVTTTTTKCRFTVWLACLLLPLLADGIAARGSEADRLTELVIVENHLCDDRNCAAKGASCGKLAHATRRDFQREDNGCARAGNPHRVAWYARPSRNKRDSLGYVGGNASWRGEPGHNGDGTWGLDFGGLFSKNHIWLNWLHDRPTRQSGGSYKTDGPHFLPH